MRHRFRNSTANGALDPKRLKAFEKELGTTLPEPYRGFLVEHNGCEFGSNELPTTFFGLHDEGHASLDGPTYPNPDFLPRRFWSSGWTTGTRRG